jgi:hypothetical protein
MHATIADVSDMPLGYTDAMRPDQFPLQYWLSDLRAHPPFRPSCILTAMLSAYMVAKKFLLAQRQPLGPTSPQVVHSQASETLHLKKIFSRCDPDRSDVTSLLDYIACDKSDAFTGDQLFTLVETASLRLSSTVVGGDGALDVVCDLHGTQKSQTHLHSFLYYTQAIWMMLMGSQSVQKKYTALSHEWLRWGLRFPSGPSFRVGLATILVAAEMIVTAKEAWQMFRDFVEEFLLVRKSTGGVATCRKFPDLPATFVLLHPLIDPNDVVPSRVDVDEIQKLCVSTRIPIRKNNAKLDPPTAVGDR